MKRLIIAALCCCLTTAASYAQQKPSDNGQTKSESCTIRESGWGIDIGIGKAGDVTREVHCDRKTEPAQREPKDREPKESKDRDPKERPGKNR